MGTLGNSSGTLGLRNNVSMGTVLNRGLIVNGTLGSNYALDNASNMTRLLNEGTINGGVGVYNQSGAFIGTVTNSATISGGSAGISNSGLISRLENTGQISATIHAIDNSTGATVGTLINSGTISGGTYGVRNQGTLSVLTNSSLISSTIINGAYAVHNTGSLGTLSNSGTLHADYGVYNTGTLSLFNNTGQIRNKTGGDSSASGIRNSTGGSLGTLSNSGTISAVAGVWLEAGSIQTVNNSGLMEGSYYGLIQSAGTLGTLINSGTLVATSLAGIYIGGNTGVVNNSGLIRVINNSGHAVTIGSSGTLGGLTNSGTIAGSISNNSSRGLTLNGGTGSIFGTLTGSDGSLATLGQITHTLANLSFGSGNLLLNSNINMGTFSANNSGATLKLVKPVTITGNYSQGAGAKLISGVADGATAAGSLTDTGYGRLHVTGNSTLASGSGVSLGKLNTYAFAAGQRFVLVSTAGTASYNEGALNYAAEGYEGSVTGAAVADGAKTNLVLTLHRKSTPATPATSSTPAVTSSTPANPATEGNARAALAGLLNYSGAHPGLLNVFNPAAALGTADAANRAGAQLSPAALQSAAMGSAQAGQQQVLHLAGTRLDGVRAGGNLAALEGQASGVSTGEGGGSPAAWGQYFGGRADGDRRNDLAGYHSSYQGLVLGADRQLGDSWRAGALFSTATTHVDLKDSNTGSSAQVKNHGVTGYATYDGEPWYVNLMASASLQSTESTRAVSFPGFAGQAFGKFSGTHYAAAAQAGYPLALVAATTLTPTFGLGYSQSRQDGYTETGGNGAALRVEASRSNSLKSDIGLKLERTITTGYGELTPSVQLRWRHEFRDARVRMGASFAADTTGFVAFGQVPVRNTGVLALGATLVSSKQLSLSANYTLETGRGLKAQTADLRLRWAF